MVVVRLLFAISVVVAHSTSHPLLKFIGTTIAVQSFFIRLLYGYDSEQLYKQNKILET